ncbi:hypothetical protein [Microbispora sp. GKU 823]|uniref:hypothetical protein n=1 Tax=Microbispora sp. GKU 823 TaxID=1652100 RepID=UPI0026B2BD77
MAGVAIAWGIAVVLAGLAAELWIALGALALGGAVNFVLSTFRTTITQARTGDAVRGRVQGALTVVLVGGPQIANLLHGVAGAAYGPRIVICAGGLLTVAAVTAIAWAIPDLRRYTAPALAPEPAVTRTPPAAPGDRISPAPASRARAGRR